jgi:hypothetical protein
MSGGSDGALDGDTTSSGLVLLALLALVLARLLRLRALRISDDTMHPSSKCVPGCVKRCHSTINVSTDRIGVSGLSTIFTHTVHVPTCEGHPAAVDTLGPTRQRA